MIDPTERLWAGSGNLRTGGPYTWYIADLDQRRFFSVTYAPSFPIQDEEETEELCIAQLQKHIDQLGEGVYGISFSEPDGPVTTSTNMEDDATVYVNYRPLSALNLLHPINTIQLSSLTELDRLGPQVDLVSYRDTPSTSGGNRNIKAVFKYWFMENGMFRTWFELNSWSRLPRNHPHIVPFSSVVLDDITGGIVGFTSSFIPGGTLWQTATTRTFCLRWLHQLIKTINDLNYLYGVMHQDIAPRNLLINKENDLQIFDFNYAIMIDKHYTPDRDDTKGVIFTLYELITLDDHFREVPHSEQDAEALMQTEWIKHPDVKLDNNVQAFREILGRWVAERKERDFTPQPTWVQWPAEMPKPPLSPVPVHGPDGAITGTEMKSVPALFRRNLASLGKPYWNWERPASYNLKDSLEDRPGQ